MEELPVNRGLRTIVKKYSAKKKTKNYSQKKYYKDTQSVRTKTVCTLRKSKRRKRKKVYFRIRRIGKNI